MHILYSIYCDGGGGRGGGGIKSTAPEKSLHKRENFFKDFNSV
jgi:hypothetical protein